MGNMGWSPWVEELRRERPVRTMQSSGSADVTIVGGGVAGMASAFNLVLRTELEVTLVEKGLVGHGASGHNGGQGIASIERHLGDLVSEKGAPFMARVLNEMENGYGDIQEICRRVRYRGVKVEGEAWSGYENEKAVAQILGEMQLRQEMGAPVRPLIVADQLKDVVEVPSNLGDKVRYGKMDEIKEQMRSKQAILACSSTPVILLNSAQLCEDIAEFLLSHAPERFHLFERSTVSEIDLNVHPIVKANGHQVRTNSVVLCTNGFPLPRIIAHSPSVIETGLRQLLASMIAFSPEGKDRNGAFIYHHDERDLEEEPYFYLTRRPTWHRDAELVSVGGPQVLFSGEPLSELECPEGVFDKINRFISRVYSPNLPDEPRLTWNGLMGYTPDGLRLVGPDPTVKNLWYNLGCNGVGLLPSICGGRQLVDMMVREGGPVSSSREG